jgi:hypothetical protein
VEESPSESQWNISRRNFVAMGGVLLGGLTLSGLKNSAFAAEKTENAQQPINTPNPRKPLIVKPVLVHDVTERKEADSWRMWGGIQSIEEANREVDRIKAELAIIKQQADYPIEFLDVSTCTNGSLANYGNLKSTPAMDKLKEHPDFAKCDTILLYALGNDIHGIQDFGKDVVIFLRWNSGPVSRHITTISSRFMRQLTDEVKQPKITYDDVVVDNLDELVWRFRALCGLKNTMGSKVITIGGASGWGQPVGLVPEIAKKLWGFEYNDVSYAELSKLIEEAKADASVMARAKKRAEDYLKIPGTQLESKMEYLVSGFMLDELFRLLMKKVNTNTITVNSCMGAIMPASKTTACMALTTLNDDGYQAYCESDFVTIPGAMLLSNISGKPVFFGNPCFPFNGTSTTAHCTAPRKMDGKTLNPVRIVTHYESDYGVAPWVDVPIGMTVTQIVPSFKSDRWLGFKGTIAGVPFKPSSCRTQITVRRDCSDKLLANNLVGFHQIIGFGDYRKELGYALRRVGIQWDNLDEMSGLQ